MIRKIGKRKETPKSLLLILGGLIICLVTVLVLLQKDRGIPHPTISTSNQAQKELANSENTKIPIKEVSVFVPYWNLDETMSDMSSFHLDKVQQRALYFGVPVTEQGIALTDTEKSQLATFMNRFGHYDHSLTIRMVNTETNLTILGKQELWGSIEDDAISLAKRYGFDRVVLDLEVSALPTDSVKKQIVAFSERFSTKAHKARLGFDMTIYGDVLYRGRPYDLLQLDKSIDRWYVMAYDFHKAKGLPGPSFPLSEGNRYPYSLETLLNEWPISFEKTQVVLGMFGYTWRVDSEGRPLKAASAVTTHQGEAKKEKCAHEKGCSVVRDPISAEMMIREEVEGGYWDETWYQDKDSIQEKLSLLRSKGVSGISFWALGYF